MLSLIHAGFECSDHCRKSYAGYVCFLQCHYLHSYKCFVKIINIPYSALIYLSARRMALTIKILLKCVFLKSHSLNYKKMKINLYVEDVMQGAKRNTLNAK